MNGVYDLFAKERELEKQGVSPELWRQDIKAQWKNIRATYRVWMPEILEAYKHEHGYDPYFMDFDRVMSPIEKEAWYYIRSNGINMLPQVPVLQYFIDFANPYFKVGLEMDGVQWHDAEKDKKRDEKLAKHGWKIIRVKGKYAYDESFMESLMDQLRDETEPGYYQ